MSAKTLLTDNGFSLEELMISLAIVGMLSAMAIPNYQHLVAKARQFEAKASLSAAYTAQKSFYAEHDSYTSCFREAGFILDQKNRFYSVGTMGGDTHTCAGGAATCYAYSWSPLTPCNVNCGALPTDTCSATTQETIKVSGAVQLINSCANQDAAGVPLSWVIHGSSFLFGAAGNISDAPVFDMWQIDDNRNLTNIQSGL